MKSKMLLFLTMFLIFITSCRKDNCDVCDSELITEFRWTQKAGNSSNINLFSIAYDDLDRIMSIEQEGHILVGCYGENQRFVSENISYIYENGEIKYGVAEVSIKDLQNVVRFKGTVYKHFVKENAGNTDIMYEVIDSVNYEVGSDYGQDTISYSYREYVDAGMQRFSITIKEFSSNVRTEYRLRDGVNVSEYLCYLDEIDPSHIGYPDFKFAKDKNPFKILNEKLGYIKFRDIQFLSADIFTDLSYYTSGPGQTYTKAPFEPEFDCNDNVSNLGTTYVILDRQCD